MKFLTALPKQKYAGPVVQLKDFTAALPPAPRKVYYEYKVPLNLWEMFGNDTVGDCECARIAHMLMLFTAHTGKMFTPSVSEILTAYSAISGYDPNATLDANGENPTDTGCATPDVLNYWQNVGISGHKIIGWAQTDSTEEAIKQAIWLFGGAALDIALYQSMMDQTNGHQPWDDPDDNLLGYHAVPFFGYGSDGLTGVTWGALQQMGWPTALKVMQGNYVVVTQDWLDQQGKSPSGLDLDGLLDQLRLACRCGVLRDVWPTGRGPA